MSEKICLIDDKNIFCNIYRMQIELQHLKKTYTSQNGAITAVNDISLKIPENKIYGIIGKSGAGKSSLVRLVSLLETPDEGAVYYGEKRVDNLSKKELISQRRKIGMIFQNFNLFSSRTAAKNIAYPLEICHTPKDIIEERVKEMLELVGLSDRADAPISTLSGGQKQRIAIARALATKPEILFCDEATSALDPQTTASILNLIREIQKKMNLTVVMITHQMEVVRDACDLVAVIENGHVVEQGSVQEIFSHPKSATTRDFISHITPAESAVPADSSERTDTPEAPATSSETADTRADTGVLRWSKQGGKYTLRFVGEDTDKPILGALCRNFNIELNLRGGGIQHLTSGNIGTMVTDITGEPEEVQRAVEYLKSNGIIVEENA